jgi:hypothetical protein
MHSLLLLLPPPLLLLLLLLLLLQKAKEMLDSMARVLKPLVDQLAAVETINAPDFLSYSTWLANQAAVKQRWDGECGVLGINRQSTSSFDTHKLLLLLLLLLLHLLPDLVLLLL